MSEKNGVRDHHFERFKVFDFREPEHLWYLLGTPQERKDFFGAVEKARHIIADGSAKMIGEVPDFICKTCLRFSCTDSPANKDPNTQIRRNVYSAIKSDDRWLEAATEFQEARLGLDEFMQIELLLIDEYWSHPEIGDPNFIFSHLNS